MKLFLSNPTRIAGDGDCGAAFIVSCWNARAEHRKKGARKPSIAGKGHPSNNKSVPRGHGDGLCVWNGMESD